MVLGIWEFCIYGAGTFSSTSSAPRVNLPSLMAIIVTPLRGMCASAVNVIAPVIPAKLLVASSAFLIA